MKQLNLFKSLLIAAIFGAASTSNGQTITHPLAYGPHTIAGTASTSNWYKDYVGVRLEVTAPSVIAGDYTYSTANNGSGVAGEWGGVIASPLVNVPIYIDATNDSFGAVPYTGTVAAAIAGKICVIWRGPIGTGAVDFGCKALHAQMAGAVACVIINEYPGQPPVGMGASTTCTGITIPVFMIGNLDGIAISGQYRSGAPVTMTITPWGSGLTNDLGFIPDGAAFSHDFAMPYNQMSANSALGMLDGAFIGNFGTSDATNVQLTSNLAFTPNGGSASNIHSDTVNFSATSAGAHYNSSVLSTTAPGANYPFAASDSIIAMFAGAEYTIPTPSGAGRYDLTYNVSSADIGDEDIANNTLKYSFYATDSLYSKGRYDFVNNKPVEGLAEQVSGGTDFIWGPMYFVGSTAGTAISTIQYYLDQNSTATPPTTVVLTDDLLGNLVFVYKWNDGAFGAAPDSLVEDGELELVSANFYQFDGVNDTSGALLQIKNRNATSNYISDSEGNKSAVYLDPNHWYYVAVDVPAATFLGVDDELNPYPRIYGRAHASNIIDYNSIVEPDSMLSMRANQINAPVPFNEGGTVIDVDSFQLHSIKGVIPAVAMWVTPSPDTSHGPSAVTNTTKPAIELSLYPNPTSEYLNVSVSLEQSAKSVTYEIVDGLGRFVSKQTHYNVQNEVYTIPTSNLKSGNYHLAVVANGKVQVRAFTVIR